MPAQNRVLPTQDIVALSFRGDLMGNRGCLHDDVKRVVRVAVSGKPWVTCATAWISRTTGEAIRRRLMAPGQYTELFFLDEPTAFAAGHRPCNKCRNAATQSFLAAAGYERVTDLDPVLHGQRVAGARQRRHPMPAGDLAEGAMAIVGDTVFARHPRGVIAWSRLEPGAYLAALDDVRDDVERFRSAFAAGDPVDALTPPVTQAALRAGYRPAWHTSAATAAVVA